MNAIVDSLGKLHEPTPELVDEFLEKNISAHQRVWIGTSAHELGHMFGAIEVKENISAHPGPGISSSIF